MRIIQEDITKTVCFNVVHGCNNKGAFGAGVAKAIADRWPVAKLKARPE